MNEQKIVVERRKVLPLSEELTSQAKDLLAGFRGHEESLPPVENNRLAVVIPARKASHLMSQNLPFLEKQIMECVQQGMISGAEVVVVLNKGGVEEDRDFVQKFQPETMGKLVLYEKGGELYSDSNFSKETDILLGRQTESRFIFIIQGGAGVNSGHIAALRTGFYALAQAAKKDGVCSKYYLTTDADSRLCDEGKESEYSNGLLLLMQEMELNHYFAIGAKIKPVVCKPDGSFDFSKSSAALVRGTSNLIGKVEAYQWCPGGGTLAKGRRALAAHMAIADRRMEVPDVSFTILTGKILGLTTKISKRVTLLDQAPEEETVKGKIDGLREILKKSNSFQELLHNPDLPADWRKMIRWIHGQQFVEWFFGKAFLAETAQFKVMDIIIGNIKAAFKQYGCSPKLVREMFSLSQALPAYFVLKTVSRRSDAALRKKVSW